MDLPITGIATDEDWINWGLQNEGWDTGDNHQWYFDIEAEGWDTEPDDDVEPHEDEDEFQNWQQWNQEHGWEEYKKWKKFSEEIKNDTVKIYRREKLLSEDFQKEKKKIKEEEEYKIIFEKDSLRISESKK